MVCVPRSIVFVHFTRRSCTMGRHSFAIEWCVCVIYLSHCKCYLIRLLNTANDLVKNAHNNNMKKYISFDVRPHTDDQKKLMKHPTNSSSSNRSDIYSNLIIHAIRAHANMDIVDEWKWAREREREKKELNWLNRWYADKMVMCIWICERALVRRSLIHKPIETQKPLFSSDTFFLFLPVDCLFVCVASRMAHKLKGPEDSGIQHSPLT